MEYTYDAFGRVTQQVTKLKGENEETPDTVILTEYFTYTAPSSTTTSAQVATYRTVGGSYDITYSYTYDDNGNITSVHDGTKWIHYAYDSANQLVREDNQDRNRTYTWTYDNAGNILYYKTYAYTRGAVGTELDSVAYGYDDEGWGDLMTSYDGTAVTYEYQQTTEVLQEDGTTKNCNNIGNPTQLNGRTYVWEHGRRLASLTMGDTTWTYSYNNAGLRTGRVGKKGNTVVGTYEYIYNGSQLVRMIKDGEIVDFTYDASGTPLTMTYDGSKYYYIVNLQGDVEGLLDENGDRVITYHYTAYGQGRYFTNEHTLTAMMATINPLGYRGYVNDLGTGLYYLQSRYYDPVIGRFINADAFVSTGQGFVGNNMFAYCGNNPVNRVDSFGYAWDFSGLIDKIVSRITDLIEFIGAVRADSIPQTDREKYSRYPDLPEDLSGDDYIISNCIGLALRKDVEASLRYYYTGASSYYTYLCFANTVGFNNVRMLSSPNEPIDSDEYMVAIKGGDTDCHFILKTDYGWFSKQGTHQGEYIDREIVHGYVWPYYNGYTYDYGSPLRYDGETIYAAVKKEWDKL